MPNYRIEHGDTVQDKITKFKGVATGRASYITGCDTILVAPHIDKDGKHIGSQWIDVARLKIVKKGTDVAASVKPLAGLAAG